MHFKRYVFSDIKQNNSKIMCVKVIETTVKLIKAFTLIYYTR